MIRKGQLDNTKWLASCVRSEASSTSLALPRAARQSNGFVRPGSAYRDENLLKS